jgi:hypothetical protein
MNGGLKTGGLEAVRGQEGGKWDSVFQPFRGEPGDCRVFNFPPFWFIYRDVVAGVFSTGSKAQDKYGVGREW